MKTIVLTLTLMMSLPLFSATTTHGEPKKVSLKEWFNQNISYPDQAVTNKEEGIVYVSFTFNTDGEVENVEVVEGISEALDNKAIEMVKEMPSTDMVENDLEEGVSYILPIKFILK
ncbi:MAG: energy transducer TonB [Flavobacteriales bacterium]|nr:energy transducer TonB [Flavobacteriales bacterium]